MDLATGRAGTAGLSCSSILGVLTSFLLSAIKPFHRTEKEPSFLSLYPYAWPEGEGPLGLQLENLWEGLGLSMPSVAGGGCVTSREEWVLLRHKQSLYTHTTY